jgi:hypothetical protein
MISRLLTGVVAFGLSIGYSYESIATGRTGTSTGTSVSSTTIVPSGCSVPAPPADLRVVSIQGSTVELMWSPTERATSYTTTISSTPGGGDVLFGHGPHPSFRFMAPVGRSYARVEAYTACGAGPASASISFVVPK